MAMGGKKCGCACTSGTAGRLTPISFSRCFFAYRRRTLALLSNDDREPSGRCSTRMGVVQPIDHGLHSCG